MKPTMKEFHIGDILSVLSGILVSPRRIEGVYDVLNWVTGENLMTHQLPDAADRAQEPLRETFPLLARVWRSRRT